MSVLNPQVREIDFNQMTERRMVERRNGQE